MDKAPVISLLAGSSFETILTFLALNRLGYAVLFLSTRLTASAYARLMEMADSHRLIIHENFQSVAADVQLEQPDCSSISLIERTGWHARPVVKLISRPDASAVEEGGKIMGSMEMLPGEP